MIPAADMPGEYEAFTCTTEYTRGRDNKDYITNYQTSNNFSATSVYGNYLYQNSADEVRINDWDFAGWRNKFKIDVEIPPTQLSSNEVGCVASRIIYAHGGLLRTITNYYPEEVEWIWKFDFTDQHEIRAGWKSWSSLSSSAVYDGQDAGTFLLDIKCDGCYAVMDGAVSLLAASGAAFLALLAF